MKSLSFLMAIIVILFAMWFLFLRDTQNVEPATTDPTTTVSEQEHQPTTTYGKAIKYSKDTVGNAYDTKNDAIEDALNNM